METTTNREEQIFLDALELSSDADRIELLIQECGDDHQLRKRVDELLAFHQRNDNILDATSDGRLTGNLAVDDSISVGAQIGPYKLLQEIGVGGMGVVYMAEQSHPVRRKVAIKIIKLGMDTRNVITRFEAERQALAMMDHPNITKVFDAGSTTSGRPYFVMELVTGLAVTDYCDRQKLSLRERIELFHQVCVGIKHAHQKGIIHRDLKPSNVMVTHYDGVAVPKIIDFGIAKAVDKELTDKTLFTSYGNIIGTPEYMSPEQAEMSGQDTDTRSDVYSLGVLLYELLTGTTPFYHWKKKGIHKFCEAICNEEPELASTRINNLANTVNDISQDRGMDGRSLNRILRGDLDWILSKCMSKNRNERYETAADLARDVKRYLEGQPVEAVGPNVGYRARKFVGKHRTAMSFAAVFMFTLLGATIVSTAFAIQATRSRQLADNRLQEVEIERDRAKAAETKLRQMERQSRSDAATARAIARFNRHGNGMIQASYPRRQLMHRPGNDISVRSQSSGNLSTNVFAVDQATVLSDSKLDEINLVQKGSQVEHRPRVESKTARAEMHSYQIVIGDEGELAVTSSESGSTSVMHSDHQHDGSKRLVIIQNQQGDDETKRFLKILADEQRELFGPDDNTVANTLIEIGNISLTNKDWSKAENLFRESRDILNRNATADPRLAKVELLLSKALLQQDKVAAAKETIVNSVGHLEKLQEVPEELLEVIVELKENLDKLNIPVGEIRDVLPADFRKQLEGKIEEHKSKIEERIELQLRKK